MNYPPWMLRWLICWKPIKPRVCLSSYYRDEIIDYRRRKKAGKMIGSGYIEKGFDQSLGIVRRRKDELA